MSVFRKLNRGETNIDFVGHRKRWFTISAVLILISLVSFALNELNLGIEFEGGVALQSPNPAGASVADVRVALEEAGINDATIQVLGDGESFRITTGVLEVDVENSAIDAVAEVTGADRNDISISAVGPTFGALILQRSLLALAVFLGVVVIFISWRLEFKMAITGIAALFHDLLLTLGVYAVTGFEVTPATIVAVLTILGYSLYDTVVVFDKIEELVAEDDKSPYPDIVNRAMNSVLFRSLNTSLTSLLPIGSILFVGSFILGASTLTEFALALFVGITAGTYSSIFIAVPLLATWKEREEEWELRAEKAARREKSARR